MKTEEIIEGNKIIAEFMGATISTHGVFECANFQEKTAEGYKSYDLIYLCYHSSWDWIFSVIEKITSLGFEIEFNIKPNWDESTFSIYDTKRDNTLVESLNFIDIENCNSLIQYVWICIVEFIQYYNQNK